LFDAMTKHALMMKLLLVLAIGLGALPPALAKGGPIGLWPQTPDASMREVLETAYARALLKQFAANVRKDGDAACLQSKALDEAALIDRGRALLQANGVRFLKLLDENFDDRMAQGTFTVIAGRKARAELDHLLQHPEVKKLEALNRPIQMTKLIDTVLEQFDRYVLVGRIKLDPVSPVGRGEGDSEATRANPVSAAEAALKAFVQKNPSPKVLDRFFDLMEADHAATEAGVKKDGLAKLGPMQYFAGADKDLADLCVGRRQ
jgi:hypothetical protein